MYVLDTNTVKAVLRNPTPYLEQQLNSHVSEVFISIIVAEEMIRGVMATLNENMRRPVVTRHYDFLRRLIADLSLFPVLGYDDTAEEIYQGFTPTVKRIGLRDCRIAASAMAQRPEPFIVVTRNLDDFRAIGAPCESWIDPPENSRG